jgi:hypothetical protein
MIDTTSLFRQGENALRYEILAGKLTPGSALALTNWPPGGE